MTRVIFHPNTLEPCSTGVGPDQYRCEVISNYDYWREIQARVRLQARPATVQRVVYISKYFTTVPDQICKDNLTFLSFGSFLSGKYIIVTLKSKRCTKI